jgi:aminoglycoside phosphotransferase (APT) family kinase protein
MHENEVDIDAELVRSLLRAQFPRWAELPIERFDSGGTVNAIYRLGDELYVRMPLLEQWSRSLKVEGRWLPRLGPHLPVAVPEILGKGVPGEGYPFHWAVVRWLDGEPWRPDRVRDMNEAALDIASFISAFHAIETAAIVTDQPAFWRKPLGEFDQWVRHSIDASSDMIDADRLTTAWEVALEAPAFDGSPIWVHSDLLRGNVLVDGGRLSAVIDFGGVHVGDPARDVAAAWTLLAGGESRGVFRDALSVDDGTWARARGWAIKHVGAIPYYRETNQAMVDSALHTIGEVLGDVR